jgi:hypothetical protein
VPRQILIQVEEVSALADLCEDVSPRMTEALWQSLPIETTLSPAKWSGSACFLHPESAALKSVTTNEAPVTSIYPGYLVARPGGGELLIAYGPSEYRWAIGTDYTTRVARLRTRNSELLKVLARTHDEGDKTIKISRASG